MARSFGETELAELARGRIPKGLPPDIAVRARRKLFMLVNAAALDDLKSPPGNRLEALAGDRKGFYSIRINDQWRFCFRWNAGRAENIELVDYH